jgi:glutamine cyclotransferase
MGSTNGVIMRKFLVYILVACSMALSMCCYAADEKAAAVGDDDKGVLPCKVLETIRLPKGYHEGLYFDGKNIWVNNGENGPTLVVDLAKKDVVSAIQPAGSFTEGIIAAPNGKYWVTDWNDKKLYLVSIAAGRMVAESSVSFEPARPTGLAFDGEFVHVITWLRGMGTRYYINKVDMKGNIVKTDLLKDISEPSQMAWDGKNFYISSWFARRIFKVDPVTMEIVAAYRSPIGDTTGLVWAGKDLWMTGTHSDLYKLELGAE